MACVSGALRPCVLPRGVCLSITRSHVGRNRYVAKGLCNRVHGRFVRMTSAKWSPPSIASPTASRRIDQTLFSAIDDINQEVLSSSHSSRSLGLKAVAGGAPPSTVDQEVVSKEDGKESQPEDLDDPPNWTVKLLYDGDCPLCMKEVEFLRERNKTYRTIKLVDINADNYSMEENAGISYGEAMGRIHGILRDGTVLAGVAVFKKVYGEVGLGWVYAVTSIGPIGKVADAVYDVWAKYRLPITGRPPLVELLEARRQKKALADECDDGCVVD